MSADESKPPLYTQTAENTAKVTGTNPNHAGYDQPVAGNQSFYMPTEQQGQPAVVRSGMTTDGFTSDNTRVVVTNQPRANFVVTATPPGSDLTLPAVFVCLFCCSITGILAIIYALQAQELYRTGAYREAESSRKKARGLIIGSVLSHVVIWTISLIVYFAVFAAAAKKASNFDTYGN